jgi:hypothetical protein
LIIKMKFPMYWSHNKTNDKEFNAQIANKYSSKQLAMPEDLKS